MSVDESKMKNLKALYEQRRERVVSRINEINLTEYTVRQYQNMECKFGILEGTCLFGVFLLLSQCILKNISASTLLSLSVGFSFVSVYNFKKYKSMKQMKEEYPEVDFNNYDFNSNDKELDKLFKELFDIDYRLLNANELFEKYELVESDNVVLYKKNSIDDIEFSNYDGYEIYNLKNEKKRTLVKKKERR